MQGEDGYRLWLRYDPIEDECELERYRKAVRQVHFPADSRTLEAARGELVRGLEGLLGIDIEHTEAFEGDDTIVVGTPESSNLVGSIGLESRLNSAGREGFVIQTSEVDGKDCIVIASKTEIGVLYGVFGFLRLIQMRKSLDDLSIVQKPKIDLRILNHWDNLDRTVERGYAGFSLWDWPKLPEHSKKRYKDYARANASIGINGVVLNNVNADPEILTTRYIKKISALADVFRPYGISVYLSVPFFAPIQLGEMDTADPLESEVMNWWEDKVEEIYEHIPDFGGFLVKADSEGQPGPHDYGRTHADGANMLADALAPWNGIVMWRAFVYEEDPDRDRAKQAYEEFRPLDGSFRDNVLLQVKNGPIDFQPREPFHPMFGSMPETPLIIEFQITQEYLGFATHLVYLAPLFKETLYSDTYVEGEGSYVAKVVDGSLENHEISGMAGVSNIGTDRNWCGHPFAQANWYAFGRLSWNHSLSPEKIADEWIRMTFTNESEFIEPVKDMMMESRETAVNYMTPLGLHHIMGRGHHYGPAPWIKEGKRKDWTSVYYHRADEKSIGFDRTETGSNAVAQYPPKVARKFSDLSSCPEKYLLWFHHLDWDYEMESGHSLWEELCYRYSKGVESVEEMKKTWKSLEGLIDPQRFKKVEDLLRIQEKEARWWRDACILYFQSCSGKSIPGDLEEPSKSLGYYKSLEFPHAPGYF